MPADEARCTGEKDDHDSSVDRGQSTGKSGSERSALTVPPPTFPVAERAALRLRSLNIALHVRGTVASPTLRDVCLSGSVGSVTSTVALALCGGAENGSAAGPINGPSQWLWGQREAYTQALTWRHTAAGYVIHHATSVLWASVYENVCRSGEPKSLLRICADAAARGVACLYSRLPRCAGALTPRLQEALGSTVHLRGLCGVCCRAGTRHFRTTTSGSPPHGTPSIGVHNAVMSRDDARRRLLLIVGGYLTFRREQMLQVGGGSEPTRLGAR